MVSCCLKCKGEGKHLARINKTLVLKDCPVCTRELPSPSGKLKSNIRPFRSDKNWIIPGPHPLIPISNCSHLLEPGEMVTSIAGRWSIFQTIKGHRYTTDDLSTAFVAISTIKYNNIKISSHADLGCGLGSVLLFVAFAFQDLKSIGFEAQELHVKLAKKSIHVNGIYKRVSIQHIDIRNTDSLPIQKFDLVTGTPPYFDTSTIPTSISENRSLCSHEIRGGIEVYIEAAVKLLEFNETSRFVVCQSWKSLERSQDLLEKRFTIITRHDFYGKKGQANPLFVVWVCGWKEFLHIGTATIKQFVRNLDGTYTDEYSLILQGVGKPPP